MKPGFIVPVTLKVAQAFIDVNHRHHKKPQGWKFGMGFMDISGPGLCGVATVGRPVSRYLDDGQTLEVTRLCVIGNTPNVCSRLYATCARIAKELGYTSIITYILDDEEGVTLKAAGWQYERPAGGGSWSCQSRPRVDKHPLNKKQLWRRSLRG